MNGRALPSCRPARTGQDAAPPRPAARRIKVPRGGLLFKEGDPVGERYYTVRYGSFKYSLANTSSQPRINAFLMSGDPLGLDAIGRQRHNGSATALEDSEVCEVRCGDLPVRSLHALLSQQIAREQLAAHWLRSSSAGRRLAAFLLDLSWRQQQRGYSPRRFRLPMARLDIANFLAMSAACLSRELAHFKDAGWLEVDERQVTLCDIEALRRLAPDTPAGATPPLRQRRINAIA